MRLLKIAFSDFTNASRNLREMKTAREMGFEVSVLCDESANEHGDTVIDGFKIRRIPLFDRSKPLGIMLLKMIPGLFMWVRYIQSVSPIVVSCHDLIPLLIAYIARVTSFRNRKIKLIYDSHELELERAANNRRKPWMKKPLKALEGFLIRRSAATFVVSESIAQALVDMYNLRISPLVIRNIPPLWEISQDICKSQRRTFCMQLGITEDCTLLMYWGGIGRGRGLAKLLQVISNLNNCSLIVMGYGESNYIEQLEQTASDLKIANRVLFHPAVPGDMIWQYAGAVDIAMITIPNISKSYYYMLPNKLFESIQSLTPVIASDFPEVRRVVKEYDIGLLVNPDSAQEITSAIETLRMDKLMYLRMKENLLKAKKILCWEKERAVLIKAYKQIL